MSLTYSERIRIKIAIDAARRKRVELFIAEECIKTCSGCSTPVDDKTEGCTKCYERHRNRERRNDPEFREKDNARRRKNSKNPEYMKKNNARRRAKLKNGSIS
jgi:hypothetical protein